MGMLNGAGRSSDDVGKSMGGWQKAIFRCAVESRQLVFLRGVEALKRGNVKILKRGTESLLALVFLCLGVLVGLGFFYGRFTRREASDLIERRAGAHQV